MRRVVSLLGVLILGIAIRPEAPAQALASAATPRIELGVPGRRNATASIAASGRFVVVTWGAWTDKDGTDVVAAVSRDGGRTFAPPVRVSDSAAPVRLAGEEPPRVALVARDGREPSIVVMWTAKAATGTRLLAARSNDGGRSFGRPGVVPGSNGEGNRGWESAAVDPAGHVIVAWLDHRALASKGTTKTPASHEPGGPAPDANAEATAVAQRSKLYVAGLDGAVRPLSVTGGVCYCCKTALAIDADGAIYAAWRHVYPGDTRDIAFTSSHDGGRSFASPRRVSEDHWVINGCPEDGPTMAIGRDHVVHLVWPTLVQASTPTGEPALALFHATTRDGREVSPREALPTEGTPRHPSAASADDGTLLVAWDEQVRGARRVAVAEAGADSGDRLRFTRLPLQDSAVGTYPVVARADGAYVMAWTAGPAAQSMIDVERLAEQR